MKVHGQYITEVASRLLKGRSAAHHINQGCCLSCGTDLDIESSSTVSKNAMIQIQRYSLLITLLNFSYSNCKHLCFNRLKECIDSDEDPRILISDFLKSLSILRSVRHQYSKTIAQVGRFVCSKLLPESLSMPSFGLFSETFITGGRHYRGDLRSAWRVWTCFATLPRINRGDLIHGLYPKTLTES